MSINPRYHISQEHIRDEFAMIQLAKKNPENFGPLYKKYHEKIFRFVYQRMDDRDVAADVTSQIFIKAMKHIGRYEDRGVPFVSWLYRIAYSEVVQHFRDHAKNRFVNVETVQVAEMLEDSEQEVLEMRIEKLKKAIKQLKEKDLNYIEMRFFERRSFKEIAEILDMEENAVKVATFRAVEKIKKYFL